MTLESTSYAEGAVIPPAYADSTIMGKNVSPEFHWAGVPEGTRSFVLTIIDPHPVARNWVHWVVVNLPAGTTALGEGVSGSSMMPKGSKELENTAGDKGYGGPAPPRGSGRHPYIATIHALSVASIDLPARPNAEQIGAALKKVVLAEATLTGYFERR